MSSEKNKAGHSDSIVLDTQVSRPAQDASAKYAPVTENTENVKIRLPPLLTLPPPDQIDQVADYMSYTPYFGTIAGSMYVSENHTSDANGVVKQAQAILNAIKNAGDVSDVPGADVFNVLPEETTQNTKQDAIEALAEPFAEQIPQPLSLGPQNNYNLAPIPAAGAKSFKIAAQQKYGNLIDLYKGIVNRPEIISIFKSPVSSDKFDSMADSLVSMLDIRNFEKNLRASNLELVFEFLEKLHPDKMKSLAEQRAEITAEVKNTISTMAHLRQSMDNAKEALNIQGTPSTVLERALAEYETRRTAASPRLNVTNVSEIVEEYYGYAGLDPIKFSNTKILLKIVHLLSVCTKGAVPTLFIDRPQHANSFQELFEEEDTKHNLAIGRTPPCKPTTVGLDINGPYGLSGERIRRETLASTLFFTNDKHPINDAFSNFLLDKDFGDVDINNSLIQPIQYVTALATFLSNELIVSAGIGKLRGTVLGDKFNVEQPNPVATIAGFPKNLVAPNDLYKPHVDPAVPGSFADFTVINEGDSFDNVVLPFERNTNNLIEAVPLAGHPLSADLSNVTYISPELIPGGEVFVESPIRFPQATSDQTIREYTKDFLDFTSSASEYVDTLLALKEKKTGLEVEDMISDVLNLTGGWLESLGNITTTTDLHTSNQSPAGVNSSNPINAMTRSEYLTYSLLSLCTLGNIADSDSNPETLLLRLVMKYRDIIDSKGLDKNLLITENDLTLPDITPQGVAKNDKMSLAKQQKPFSQPLFGPGASELTQPLTYDDLFGTSVDIFGTSPGSSYRPMQNVIRKIIKNENPGKKILSSYHGAQDGVLSFDSTDGFSAGVTPCASVSKLAPFIQGRSIIKDIFALVRDYQKSSQKLAGSASFLNDNGKTNYSKLDEDRLMMIVVKMVIECYRSFANKALIPVIGITVHGHVPETVGMGNEGSGVGALVADINDVIFKQLESIESASGALFNLFEDNFGDFSVTGLGFVTSGDTESYPPTITAQIADDFDGQFRVVLPYVEMGKLGVALKQIAAGVRAGAELNSMFSQDKINGVGKNLDFVFGTEVLGGVAFAGGQSMMDKTAVLVRAKKHRTCLKIANSFLSSIGKELSETTADISKFLAAVSAKDSEKQPNADPLSAEMVRLTKDEELRLSLQTLTGEQLNLKTIRSDMLSAQNTKSGLPRMYASSVHEIAAMKKLIRTLYPTNHLGPDSSDLIVVAVGLPNGLMSKLQAEQGTKNSRIKINFYCRDLEQETLELAVGVPYLSYTFDTNVFADTSSIRDFSGTPVQNSSDPDGYSGNLAECIHASALKRYRSGRFVGTETSDANNFGSNKSSVTINTVISYLLEKLFQIISPHDLSETSSLVQHVSPQTFAGNDFDSTIDLHPGVDGEIHMSVIKDILKLPAFRTLNFPEGKSELVNSIFKELTVNKSTAFKMRDFNILVETVLQQSLVNANVAGPDGTVVNQLVSVPPQINFEELSMIISATGSTLLRPAGYAKMMHAPGLFDRVFFVPIKLTEFENMFSSEYNSKNPVNAQIKDRVTNFSLKQIHCEIELVDNTVTAVESPPTPTSTAYVT